MGLQWDSGEKDSVVSEGRLKVCVEGDGCCGQRECCFLGRICVCVDSSCLQNSQLDV